MRPSAYTERAGALADRIDGSLPLAPNDFDRLLARDAALAQMETAVALHRIADAVEEIVRRGVTVRGGS